jgi:spoIIIJ-associated protein
MKALEIEAKSIDEAIEKACRELGRPREKLNIEILSEGSSGILGLGAKKARIRASLLFLETEFQESLEAEEEKEAKKDREAVPEEMQKEAPDGFAAERAKEFLEGLLAKMGLDFPVGVEEDEETITLKISGDGSGILIGKSGQTLDAIQYIVNKARGQGGRDRKRIVLDTEEYRGRREEYLVSLAEKLAEKVKRTRKPITVSYMSARDRRIIHLALKGEESLVTKSRGEGAYRKIVILPAKKNDKH